MNALCTCIKQHVKQEDAVGRWGGRRLLAWATGLGVFATEPIRKNKYIVEDTGPLLTDKQCDERPDNRYWFEVNSRWTIDGSVGGSGWCENPESGSGVL